MTPKIPKIPKNPPSQIKPSPALKERILSYTGNISGGASIISSYTLCHQICLGLIALLSVIGISVAGMPLAFLSRYTFFFWGLGAAILGVTSILFYYHKYNNKNNNHKGCISGKLLVANGGFLIAGIPFAALINYQRILWILGGAVVASSIASWAVEKQHARHARRRAQKNSDKACCQHS